MRTISFDTSSLTLHLSLLEGSTVLLEREVAASGNERQEVASLLMPELDSAFKETGWSKKDVEAVCVGVGPGSFTGIRVAVISGRTLAQVFKCPAFGVSILEALYTAIPGKEPAALILSSTSGQFFYGAYCASESDPAAPAVAAGAGLATHLQTELSGVKAWYGDEKSCEVFAEQGCQPLPKLKNIATAQAQLMFDRLSLKGVLSRTRDDISTLAEDFHWSKLLPLYLRSPSVTIKKNHATENPPHVPR